LYAQKQLWFLTVLITVQERGLIALTIWGAWHHRLRRE